MQEKMYKEMCKAACLLHNEFHPLQQQVSCHTGHDKPVAFPGNKNWCTTEKYGVHHFYTNCQKRND